jgi:hypothetical protein
LSKRAMVALGSLCSEIGSEVSFAVAQAGAAYRRVEPCTIHRTEITSDGAVRSSTRRRVPAKSADRAPGDVGEYLLEVAHCTGAEDPLFVLCSLSEAGSNSLVLERGANALADLLKKRELCRGQVEVRKLTSPVPPVTRITLGMLKNREATRNVGAREAS